MNKQKKLEKELEKQITSLPDWHKIIRGTLIKYYLTCGKEKCHCHKSKQERHGPYWYISVNFGRGKTKMYLIGKEQVKEAKQRINAYYEMWNRLCKISTLNIKLFLLKKRKRR